MKQGVVNDIAKFNTCYIPFCMIGGSYVMKGCRARFHRETEQLSPYIIGRCVGVFLRLCYCLEWQAGGRRDRLRWGEVGRPVGQGINLEGLRSAISKAVCNTAKEVWCVSRAMGVAGCACTPNRKWNGTEFFSCSRGVRGPHIAGECRR